MIFSNEIYCFGVLVRKFLNLFRIRSPTLFSISIYSKWNEIFTILKNYRTTCVLILTSILIVGNWFTWIYAVTVNKLIDAAFGYYIFPILSVFFGILFLKESHNKMHLFTIGS